jgi:hypothetical protein
MASSTPILAATLERPAADVDRGSVDPQMIRALDDGDVVIGAE